MKIPEFIDWLLKQDQQLEVGIVELQTEYKEYSGKEETQLNTFCFTMPEEQSSVQNGVLILGNICHGQSNSNYLEIPLQDVDKATKDYLIMILENSDITFEEKIK